MLGLSYSSYVSKSSHVATKDLSCKHEFSFGSDSAAGGNLCNELFIAVIFQRLLLSPFVFRYCPIGGAIFMNNPKITSISLARLE